MVRGLFPQCEQESVLDVLGRSVVFLTLATIDTVLEETQWLHMAWDLETSISRASVRSCRRRPEWLEAHPGAVLSAPPDASPRTRGSVMPRAAPRAPTVTIARFRDDPLYPRIARAVAAILEQGKVVTPVDVLVGMGLLAPTGLEDWRRGRTPYLEQVIGCNLARLSRLLRILQFHAHELKLTPSTSVYLCWGNSPKQRLRFTKTGEAKLEEAYARHFLWPGKSPFHPPTPKEPRE